MQIWGEMCHGENKATLQKNLNNLKIRVIFLDQNIISFFFPFDFVANYKPDIGENIQEKYSQE